MRVVLDARSVVRKKSGIGTYVDALVRHLVPMAGDMEFLVLRHPSATGPLTFDERVTEVTFPAETKSVHTVLTLGLARSFRRFDLYHSPADLVPLGIRCPWVVTVHDLMWVETPKLASAFPPARIANGVWYRKNLERSVGGARRVIAISASTASDVARVYPDAASKVRVVHHGVDRRRFAATPPVADERLRDYVPPTARFSLAVGQGSPYKNHAGIVRAFLAATRDDADHRLVLVRRFARVDAEMRRVLGEPEALRKVITLPFVPDDVLLGLYQRARMLLFASHAEGFGLPVLEAMATGLPVLASRAPALLEVTGDAALHVESSDHEALRDAIRRLDEDEGLRRRLIRAGHERVLRFSWRECASRTLAVYREAIDERFSAARRPESAVFAPSQSRS